MKIITNSIQPFYPKVMLKDGQTAKEGQLIAKDLMEKLGVQENDLLDCAYMDLILQQDRK